MMNGKKTQKLFFFLIPSYPSITLILPPKVNHRWLSAAVEDNLASPFTQGIAKHTCIPVFNSQRKNVQFYKFLNEQLEKINKVKY